jgi:hypothetical protein
LGVKKITPSYQGSEGKKQRRIRAWMHFQEKRVVDTPGFELGGKAATRATILRGQCVAGNVAGFPFDGRFHTMMEFDFCLVFLSALLFGFIPQKNKKRPGHWSEK